jgi:hypothetical protein
MIIPTHDELAEVMIRATEFEREINDLLEKGEYNTILDRFKHDDIKSIAGRNQRIYILSIMIQLIVMEIDKTGTTSLAGRNTSEIIRIYKILTLYLRRIEFDLPADTQNDIVNYIKQERLSLPIIVGIISNNSIIIQKQKVFDSIGTWWGKIYE